MPALPHALIILSPALEAVDDALEALPKLCEAVFDLRRDFGIDLAANELCILELAEILCQNLLRNALFLGCANRPSKLTKAPLAKHQIMDNQNFPFVANQVERGFHRAWRIVGAHFFVHCLPLIPNFCKNNHSTKALAMQ